ncbi:pyridoxal phosphate-dependent aminotransferase [Lachnoanaerobaculum orale]|uniref:cysteine-S-conjugate beta-lyase n=1 Tax=Lachnoanaerobaculum orale TaxID=979627 RepID=A0A3P3PXL7_9FIRM|nr:MalY/PatB family protein [Lachnoanaerobaculum orale]RRJ13706.1 pyridoxal phosphate-dependent aminotransferase [Lachnoanaerobaculum orale]
MYDFDKIIDRHGTNCLKFDFAKERGKNGDELSLWVADMDFQVAKPITDALQAQVNHGIYGYTEVKSDYFDIVKNWFRDNFDWEIKKGSLVKTPGVVYAIAMAVKAFTKEGEAVIIQQPVYYPFSEMIIANNRKLVNSPLVLKDGRYEIDFEDFEKKIVENNVKLFILCSPHNPVGRVWSVEELKRIGDICIKHDVVIFSDEIHADFVYEPNKHHVFASLGESYAANSVIATAPSKSFNIAGLQVSNIFIGNKKLRDAFRNEIVKSGYSQLNTMGLAAARAAYESGKEWLDEVRAYIKDNLIFFRDYLKENIGELSLIEPEGTYLVWVDFRKLGLSEKQREDLIVNKAKLWIDSGAMFGVDGEGFERFNIACTREYLKMALDSLAKAIKGL